MDLNNIEFSSGHTRNLVSVIDLIINQKG
ncbi:hypothetical protein JMJ77_0002977, partial [Colletotrichum scovillei]